MLKCYSITLFKLHIRFRLAPTSTPAINSTVDEYAIHCYIDLTNITWNGPMHSIEFWYQQERKLNEDDIAKVIEMETM